MTHKQKPSQSIIIPFTARTNARYTLFSPSSPADAQLRPGSAAISPGGIGANAGLSPRRPTDGRTAGAPPPRERPSARPSLPAAGTEPHRGRRHRRCPRAREEPGRTGHGARKGRKERRGAAPHVPDSAALPSPGPGAPAASERRLGTAARCGAAAPPPLTATSAAFFVHVGAARSALRDGRGSGRPRAQLLPPLSSSFAAALPGPGPPHPAPPHPGGGRRLGPAARPSHVTRGGAGGRQGPAGSVPPPSQGRLSSPCSLLPSGGGRARAAGSLPAAVCFWASRRGLAALGAPHESGREREELEPPAAS